MIRKTFIKAGALLQDSFALARMIFDSGYRPDVLLVLWRGGSMVGMVIHEFFRYKGIEIFHLAVKAESYTGVEKRIEPRIEHAEAVLSTLKRGCKVLVVDDIFDTGCTLKKVIQLVSKKASEVRTATLYLKNGKSRVDIEPDYCLRRTDRWIVFPHELQDLTPAEIRRKDRRLAKLVGKTPSNKRGNGRKSRSADSNKA